MCVIDGGIAMELVLQKGLKHQQDAVNAISEVFTGVEITPPNAFFENPGFSLADPSLIGNIKELQKNLPVEYRSKRRSSEYLNLDIKMETGTGKTYVYTQAI